MPRNIWCGRRRRGIGRVRRRRRRRRREGEGQADIADKPVSMHHM
jgi:hypothetical protein